MCFKKEQDKTSEKDHNETEINDVYDKELKVMIIKMLAKFRGRMDEQSENFNRDRKYKSTKWKSQS